MPERALLQLGGVTVSDWWCPGGTRGWGPDATQAAAALVLPLAGAHVRRLESASHVVLPSHAVWQPAGTTSARYAIDEQPERATHLTVRDEEVEALVEAVGAPGARGSRPAPPRVLALAPHDVLRHHALRRAVAWGDTVAAHEHALALVEGAARGAPATAHAGRPRGTRARRLALDVLALMTADPTRAHTLDGLARAAGVTPAHLSRTFHAVVGAPVHRALVRLRLAYALDRMVGASGPHGGVGAPTLSQVAADAGFASHSHFTASFRREFGCAPSAFRARRSPRTARTAPWRRASMSSDRAP